VQKTLAKNYHAWAPLKISILKLSAIPDRLLVQSYFVESLKREGGRSVGLFYSIILSAQYPLSLSGLVGAQGIILNYR
jgi:hypothetical protein